MKETDLQIDKIGSRLREVRLAKKLNQERFYGAVTKHVSNFSAIENGKRSIGERLSKDICDYYQINMEWLRTGEGEMFTEQTFPGIMDIAISSTTESTLGVPFFDVNLTEMDLGEGGLFREPPEYYVNFRPFNDCDAYLPIYGESMYPRYMSGEIIAVREIRNFDVILWGEAYLVVADQRANNMATVKLLFEHQNGDKIILRSSNPDFKGDTVIDKKAIKRLFIVKGKVTRNQL